MVKRILLYGAGGHGKAVFDAVKETNDLTAVGFLDDTKTGTHMGLPILGNGDLLSSLHNEEVDEMFVCIGNNAERARIIGRLEGCNLALGMVVHPSAVVSSFATLAPGCLVLSQASIGPDTHLGKGCIVNTGATVDHDNVLGNYVHISPGVHLAGNVHIDDHTHVGIGSVIKEEVRIGSNVTIGAGSVVLKDLPDNCIAYGCPAKPQ